MIVYNYDADLEVSDTCVRSSQYLSVLLGAFLLFYDIFLQFYVFVPTK